MLLTTALRVVGDDRQVRNVRTSEGLSDMKSIAPTSFSSQLSLTAGSRMLCHSRNWAGSKGREVETAKIEQLSVMDNSRLSVEHLQAGTAIRASTYLSDAEAWL